MPRKILTLAEPDSFALRCRALAALSVEIGRLPVGVTVAQLTFVGDFALQLRREFADLSWRVCRRPIDLFDL